MHIYIYSIFVWLLNKMKREPSPGSAGLPTAFLPIFLTAPQKPRPLNLVPVILIQPNPKSQAFGGALLGHLGDKSLNFCRVCKSDEWWQKLEDKIL